MEYCTIDIIEKCKKYATCVLKKNMGNSNIILHCLR